MRATLICTAQAAVRAGLGMKPASNGQRFQRCGTRPANSAIGELIARDTVPTVDSFATRRWRPERESLYVVGINLYKARNSSNFAARGLGPWRRV